MVVKLCARDEDGKCSIGNHIHLYLNRYIKQGSFDFNATPRDSIFYIYESIVFIEKLNEYE
jgi:hypothetical protein